MALMLSLCSLAVQEAGGGGRGVTVYLTDELTSCRPLLVSDNGLVALVAVVYSFYQLRSSPSLQSQIMLLLFCSMSQSLMLM